MTGGFGYTGRPACCSFPRGGTVFGRLRSLEAPDCPFVNLPEKHRSRWGEGLTAEDMNFCSLLHGEMSSFKGPPGVVKENSHFPAAAFERRRAGDFVEAPIGESVPF